MMQRRFSDGFLAIGLLLGVGWTAAPAEEAAKAAALGDKVPNSGVLRDLHGNRRPLHDFKDHAAVVLVFLGTECPISNLYLPGLIELEKKYRAKKVQFLAIYANEADDLDQIAGHAVDRDVPFPVLKDFGQKLAGPARRQPGADGRGPRRRLRAALPRPDRRSLRRRFSPCRRRRATTLRRPSTKCSPARR